jgi:hypothetical protein
MECLLMQVELEQLQHHRHIPLTLLLSDLIIILDQTDGEIMEASQRS